MTRLLAIKTKPSSTSEERQKKHGTTLPFFFIIKELAKCHVIYQSDLCMTGD